MEAKLWKLIQESTIKDQDSKYSLPNQLTYPFSLVCHARLTCLADITYSNTFIILNNTKTPKVVVPHKWTRGSRLELLTFWKHSHMCVCA